jgi:hypothetical protein
MAAFSDVNLMKFTSRKLEETRSGGLLLQFILSPKIFLLHFIIQATKAVPTPHENIKLPLCLTNLAPCHKGVWGNGCIDPHFLDLGTSWR